MSASLHLARYSAHATAGMLRSMRPRYRALAASPGVSVVRLYMLAELDARLGGTPIPTRWGLLLGWEGSEARARGLADATALHSFLAGARESWSVSLDPVRVMLGDLQGWRPSTDGVERSSDEEPVMVMTYGRVGARHLPAFTRSNLRIVREVRSNPGMVMSVGAIDHLRARSTLSLWSSQQAAVQFAYRSPPHDQIQRHSLDQQWFSHQFFARFRPVASAGSWEGRDPLAGLIKES